LLVEVVLLQLLHKTLNLDLFCLNEIIQGHFHPHKHGVNITSFLLNSQVLLSIQEVIFSFEFIPQLLAPLGENTQNGRMFDD
jgi:hypothetical protein